MPDLWRKATDSPTEIANGRDRKLAELADAQHGVVSLVQLQGLSLSASGVRYRVRAGRLHPIHRGVYAVGRPDLNRRGRWLAAVLACGSAAWLSHRSSCELQALLEAGSGPIHVTTPSRRGRTIPGISAHQAKLLPEDLTVIHGIPCTTVPRSLLDLARTAGEQTLTAAIKQAEVERVFDLASVNALLMRSRRHPGAGRLRNAIAALHPEAAHTRRALELRFLALCTDLGLPSPEVNGLIEVAGNPLEVDFVWRAQRLAVETDSWTFHGTRRASRTTAAALRALLLG